MIYIVTFAVFAMVTAFGTPQAQARLRPGPPASPAAAPAAAPMAPRRVRRPRPMNPVAPLAAGPGYPANDLFSLRARRRFAAYLRLRLLEMREAGLERAADAVERRLPVDSLVPPH
jgi:hypothetical protein